MGKWNDRLAKALAVRGLKSADLVRYTKKKSPSVSGWVTGNTKMLEAGNAALICKYLQINLEWLMFGKLPSGLENSVVLQDADDGDLEVPHLKDLSAIPDRISTTSQMRLSLPWLRKHVECSDPRNLALIEAQGPSMEPTFRDGDILLVDRGQNELKTDAVFVLATADQIYIKGIQRMADASYLMISHNSTSRDVAIGDGSAYQVIGRVVYVWNGKKL